MNTIEMVKQMVLALEAIEGTDACIRRAGALCRAGGFTVVKVAKPQQDMRFDVPTVGRKTLETMVQSGGATLHLIPGQSPHTRVNGKLLRVDGPKKDPRSLEQAKAKGADIRPIA